MGSRQQTHCRAGHSFTPDNTRWVSRKARGRRKAGVFRECRTCHNDATKLYDVFKRTSPKKRNARKSTAYGFRCSQGPMP